MRFLKAVLLLQHGLERKIIQVVDIEWGRIDDAFSVSTEIRTIYGSTTEEEEGEEK